MKPRSAIALCTALLAGWLAFSADDGAPFPLHTLGLGSAAGARRVAFSPRGHYVAIAGAGRAIHLLETEHWSIVGDFEGGMVPMAFSPDEAVIASGKEGDAVQLWDVASRAPLGTLTGVGGSVSSVAFSGDGSLLALATPGLTLSLWNVATGVQLWSRPKAHAGALATIRSLAVSPDGSFVASGAAGIRTGNVVKLWNAASGEEVRALAGSSDPLGLVESIAFSPDGQILATAGVDRLVSAAAAGAKDRFTVRLWDPATGQLLHTFSVPGAPTSSLTLAFSPDGLLLATACYGGGVKLWDVVTGAEVSGLASAPYPSDTVDATRYADGAAFDADGRILASVLIGSLVRLWDVATGQILGTLPVATGHSGAVNSVAFSPDGMQLVSGSEDRTVILWDVSTGTQMRTVRGHNGPVRSVAFSPDGMTIASGSDDKSVRLWDASTGLELRALCGHEDVVTSVAFSPDGSFVASGSWDKTIRFWDTATGAELRVLEGLSAWVLSLAISRDGRYLVAGLADNTVRLWEVATGAELTTLATESTPIHCVAFSPDGRSIAAAASQWVSVWDVVSGSVLCRLEGHTDMVTSVGFSPDGRTLATASSDNTIRLWDVAAGTELWSLLGHAESISGIASGLSSEGAVNAVAFSPDGGLLASGAADATIKLWAVPAQSSATIQARVQSE